MNTQKKPIALVTGASSGIGAVTAKRLVAAGYTVYGTSRKGVSIDPSFQMLCLDVTVDDAVAACVQTVIAREGRIDLLVNNAGFGVAPSGAEESSLTQAQAIFDTNFFGTVRMTHAVIPHMRLQGAGRIINIGSVLGFLPMPFMAMYAATKHAIEGYSESLDHELRTQGIRVMIVEPAFTKTSFEANALEPDCKRPEYDAIRQHLATHMKQQMEMGDSPDVVAETVLKAATQARPQLRYTAGRKASTLRLIRKFAPASAMDSGIRKDMKLNTVL
jgi:short-subunit dehydrogenase